MSIDRRDFLVKLGVGAVGTGLISCLGGCKKSVAEAPSNVNFTIDLNASSNSALLTAGGSIYQSNIIIARTSTNTFLAVYQSCPHEGVRVDYELGNNDFYCNAHGSRFSSTGALQNGPATSGLKQYTVTQSGNILTIKG